MVFADIAIAAPIWARTPAETERLYRSVIVLSGLGLPVVLADGGSDNAFLESIGALPNITVRRRTESDTPGLVGQVRRALDQAAALGPRLILYTEPDKEEFLRDKVVDLLKEARGIEDFGMLLPGRDDASFQTFPAVQRVAEQAFNAVCGHVLGQTGDYVYGPMVLKPELVPYLETAEADLGWGWRTLFFVVAHRLGQPIHLQTGDFPCPLDQRGEDTLKDQAYRLEQMRQNVAGIRQGLLLPLNEK